MCTAEMRPSAFNSIWKVNRGANPWRLGTFTISAGSPWWWEPLTQRVGYSLLALTGATALVLRRRS